MFFKNDNYLLKKDLHTLTMEMIWQISNLGASKKNN